MASKAAHAPTIPIDVELGSRNQITSSASYLTPDEQRSKTTSPTPQEIRKLRIWTTLEERLPAPIARWSQTTVGWMSGPEPPRKYRITPLLERIQTLPVRLLGRLPQWVRPCIYGIAFVLWAIAFGVILTNFSLPSDLAGFGAPVRLTCVTNLW